MAIRTCQLSETAYGVGLDDTFAKMLGAYCAKNEVMFSQDALREAIIIGIRHLYSKCKPAPPESEVQSGVGEKASSNNGG